MIRLGISVQYRSEMDRQVDGQCEFTAAYITLLPLNWNLSAFSLHSKEACIKTGMSCNVVNVMVDGGMMLYRSFTRSCWRRRPRWRSCSGRYLCRRRRHWKAGDRLGPRLLDRLPVTTTGCRPASPPVPRRCSAAGRRSRECLLNATRNSSTCTIDFWRCVIDVRLFASRLLGLHTTRHQIII